MPGFPCCCSKSVTCTTNCEDDKANKYYSITIDGLTGSPGGCRDCSHWNATYWVIQGVSDPFDTECTFSCFWDATNSCIQPGNLALTFYVSAGHYFAKVELAKGGTVYHTYKKDYGTSAPNCDALVDSELTWDSDTNSPNCDGSSSTCFITGTNSSSSDYNCCHDACVPDEIPDDISIEVLSTTECSGALNATYVMSRNVGDVLEGGNPTVCWETTFGPSCDYDTIQLIALGNLANMQVKIFKSSNPGDSPVILFDFAPFVNNPSAVGGLCVSTFDGYHMGNSPNPRAVLSIL